MPTVTDTPIIDAAIAAANDINHPTFRDLITAALRAALPWDLPAERLEAMSAAITDHGNARLGRDLEHGWTNLKEGDRAEFREDAIAAYRANPIMRELYPEKFR
jgi:hypothetical protein